MRETEDWLVTTGQSELIAPNTREIRKHNDSNLTFDLDVYLIDKYK